MTNENDPQSAKPVYGLSPRPCPAPGHPTHRGDDGWLRVPDDFDFGAGKTYLDERVSWLGDHDYLAQWSGEEWLTAAECLLQLSVEPAPAGLCACAPVPAWFLEVVGPKLKPDFDVPAPTIGRCDGPDGIDWLALHAADPNRWKIEFPWDRVPTLDQVRTVQDYVARAGGESGLFVNFDSPAADSIYCEGTGLAITWPSAVIAAAQKDQIAKMFLGTSTYLTHPFDENEQLWLWC